MPSTFRKRRIAAASIGGGTAHAGRLRAAMSSSLLTSCAFQPRPQWPSSMAPYLFVGALVNAAAVSAAVASVVIKAGLAVTVIACGERWPSAGEDGALRFALEDFLGAGAILSRLPFDKSPEALVCEQAFRGAQGHLHPLLYGCASGRELTLKGRAADVEYAARLDCCDAVPIMRDECLAPFHPE